MKRRRNERLLIALAGLPASGKTALARRLQIALPAVRLDKDEVRAFLFAAHVDYTREQNDLCVRICYQSAAYLLGAHPEQPVILDGRTYSRAYQVEALQGAVQEADARLCLIECVCSEASARQRLANDAHEHPAADRDFSMYQRSRREAEPIELPRLVIDTDVHGVAEAETQVQAYIAGVHR